MVLPDGFAEPDKDQWRDREFCGIAFWKVLLPLPPPLYHFFQDLTVLFCRKTQRGSW